MHLMLLLLDSIYICLAITGYNVIPTTVHISHFHYHSYDRQTLVHALDATALQVCYK